MSMIDAPITVMKPASMAEAGFGDLVKAVVDVQRDIMAVDGELHSIRPSQGNRSRGVDVPGLRERMARIDDSLVLP